MAHQTITKGRHSELLAQTALLANGYSVAEPIAPEPYDLVAKAPGESEWKTYQIKSARTRDDRKGEIVCNTRKNSGKAYDKQDCDFFIAVLDGKVYVFPNREISEYWVTAESIDEKWQRLETGIENLAQAEALGSVEVASL